MYVCLCKSITESEVLAMIARHGGCLACVKQDMGLDESCCGRCDAKLEELLKEVLHATNG